MFVLIVGWSAARASASVTLEAWSVAVTPDLLAQTSTGLIESVKANWFFWVHVLWSLVSVFLIVKLRLLALQGGGRRAGREEYPWYIWVSCALLVWFAAGIGAGIALSLSGVSFGLRFGSIRAQAIQSLCAFGLSILVAGILLRLLMGGEKNKGGLGLHAQGAAHGLWGFLILWPLVWCAGTLAAGVFKLVTGQWPERLAHATLATLANNPRDPWTMVLGAIAVFVAPLQEEIIYRGLLQTGLKRLLFGSPWPAVLVASGLFALAHRLGEHPMPWNAVATVGVLGVGMGFLYERTRSLLAPVVVHCLFNAANVALALNM